MTTSEFIRTINQFVPFDDEDDRSNANYLDDLTDLLLQNFDSHLAIEPMLRLIERYPETDFGSPGPLVHTMEKFPGIYENYLFESIVRKPVPLTIWMLNRVINAAKDASTRLNIMEKMENILLNPRADDNAKAEASDFLDYQRNG